jgi:hypothetical protein
MINIRLNDKTVFTLGIFFALLVLSLSFYCYLSFVSISKKVNTVATSNPIATNIPSPSPIVLDQDLKKNKIEVLNATKTKGLAKLYADKLIKLGYTNVTSSNFDGEIAENTLYSSYDFKEDLSKIDFKEYKFIKNKSIGDTIKIIITK